MRPVPTDRVTSLAGASVPWAAAGAGRSRAIRPAVSAAASAVREPARRILLLLYVILTCPHRNDRDIVAPGDADHRTHGLARGGRNAARGGASSHCCYRCPAAARARCCAGSGKPRRRPCRSDWCRSAGWRSGAASAARHADRHLAGTCTSPEAMARSSSALLSARLRSDSESWPMVCATAIFSAILGVASKVIVETVWATWLPASSRAFRRWSTASTRMLRTIVSEARSGGPSPPPSTSWVRTRSTRSPGKTKPATPRRGGDADGDGAHARAERRGEEAALAGTNDGALGQRLAGGDLGADDGADQALRVGARLRRARNRRPAPGPAARAGSGRPRRR